MKDNEARKEIQLIHSILNNKMNNIIYIRRKKVKDNPITISGSPFAYPYQISTTVEVDIKELLESILDYLNLDVVPKDTSKKFTLVERDKE